MSATGQKPVEPGKKDDLSDVRFRSEGATQSKTIGWQLFLSLSARFRPVFGRYNCGSFLEPTLLSDHHSASILRKITSSRTFPNDR
jgi:hypothetical protein